jgi:predicted nucleic acid-binding Zn ribbon protein
MEKRDPEIAKLGEVLDKSLKRLDPSGRLVEYGVWPIWNEAVGDTIARNAQPEKIRQGTLFVKVSSPVWMQQLQYLKETVAEKLNHALGKEVVKNLFFFIGSVRAETAEQKAAAQESPAASVAQPSLDEETLSPVKDPEIRRALKRLFAAHSRKRKR